MIFFDKKALPIGFIPVNQQGPLRFRRICRIRDLYVHPEALTLLKGEVHTWICSVCGYEHVGTEPPKECPRCGMDAMYFDAVE